MSQAARTAESSVINAPDDKNIGSLGLNIGAGDTVKLYENGKMIFFGEVQTAEKLARYGTVTYSCTDLLAHLLPLTAFGHPCGICRAPRSALRLLCMPA